MLMKWSGIDMLNIKQTNMWGDLYLLGEHIDQVDLRVPGVGIVQVWGASQRARAQLSNKEVL